MGRRTVTPFANQIKRVLPPKHVIDLGRRGAFCHRERLITPHRLMRSLLASHAMGRVETLADIHRQFHALFGATVAYKPFHNQFPTRDVCARSSAVAGGTVVQGVEFLCESACVRYGQCGYQGRLQSGLKPVS